MDVLVYLTVHLLNNIWLASSFWLLQIKFLWAFVYILVFFKFSIYVTQKLKKALLSCILGLVFLKKSMFTSGVLAQFYVKQDKEKNMELH